MAVLGVVEPGISRERKGAGFKSVAKLETAGSAEDPALWGCPLMEGTLGAADCISFREGVRCAALRFRESGIALAGS